MSMCVYVCGKGCVCIDYTDVVSTWLELEKHTIYGHQSRIVSLQVIYIQVIFYIKQDRSNNDRVIQT